MRNDHSRKLDRQDRFLRLIAATFAELGYRRATTAELARRCGARENELYRLWPSKKAMFLAAIDYVYDSSVGTWLQLLSRGDSEGDPALRLLSYEAEHHGEFRLYRIVFAGLSETDDAEIREALRRMYRRFHQFIAEQLAARPQRPEQSISAEVVAWGVIGIGTVSNILRELGLATETQRRELFTRLGQTFLKPDGR